MYARFAERLRGRFTSRPPAGTALEALLDKAALGERARAAGLAAPPAWRAEESGRAADEAAFPVIIKLRSQVGAAGQSKGIVVEGPAELETKLRRFRNGIRYDSLVAEAWPAITTPIVQEYLGHAPVYSLTGYVARDGRLAGARASRKVLQSPPAAGLGVCFEGATVDPALAEKVRRLSLAAGYHGIFEAEFSERDGQLLLIDFNPRIYGQMAFDVARGADPALLAYADAIGDEAMFARLAADAARPYREDLVYCDRPRMWRVLRGRPKDEQRRWRRWRRRNRGRTVNPAASRHDPGPGLSALAANVAGAIYARAAGRAG